MEGGTFLVYGVYLDGEREFLVEEVVDLGIYFMGFCLELRLLLRFFIIIGFEEVLLFELVQNLGFILCLNVNKLYQLLLTLQQVVILVEIEWLLLLFFCLLLLRLNLFVLAYFFNNIHAPRVVFLNLFYFSRLTLRLFFF